MKYWLISSWFRKVCFLTHELGSVLVCNVRIFANKIKIIPFLRGNYMCYLKFADYFSHWWRIIGKLAILTREKCRKAQNYIRKKTHRPDRECIPNAGGAVVPSMPQYPTGLQPLLAARQLGNLRVIWPVTFNEWNVMTC